MTAAQRHPLANALGRVLARSGGLVRLQLPRILEPSFARQVANAANDLRGDPDFAHVVRHSPGEGEISPEAAIKVRTREDGRPANALLVHRQGDFKELKSLEVFRLVNPGVIPTGLLGQVAGELAFGELVSELARNFPELASSEGQQKRLSDTLSSVFGFLAAAYQSSGADEINWTDAWWLHISTALSNLQRVSGLVPVQHGASRPVLATYVAAGLPFPDNLLNGAYSKVNSPKKYAQIIRERWTSSAIVDLAIRDVRDHERRAERLSKEDEHPLKELGWENIAATKSRLGHPILATSFHGSDQATWPRAWSLTSESGFFSGPLSSGTLGDDLALVRLLRNEIVQELPTLSGLETPVFIADLSDVSFEKGAAIEIGSFAVPIPPESPDLSVVGESFELSCSPKALAAKAVRVIEIENTRYLVFELHLRLGGGAWREGTYGINIAPITEDAKEILRGDKAVQILLAHPGRGSIWLIEHSRTSSGKARLLTHSATRFSVEGGKISAEMAGTGEYPFFRLGRSTGSFDIVSAGSEKPVMVAGADGTSTTVSSMVANAELPVSITERVRVQDDIKVELDGFSVEVRVPDQAVPHLSPFTACATGETVSPDADSTTLDLLGKDPRKDLEEWLAREFVLGSPSSNARSSLGIVALAGARETRKSDLVFDIKAGYFRTQDVFGHPRLPEGTAGLPEVEAFWDAFEALGLRALAGEDNIFSAWPSRLDLRLLGRDKIENYLSAYAGLLSKAQAFQQSVLYAYPFSALVISNGTSEGVLLSPLHPLRLGWSWSVQNAAAKSLESRSSDEVLDLMRFVDGMDFPAIAPSTHDEHLLALPLDAGLGGVFSPWSFLAANRVMLSGTGDISTLLGRRFPFGAASGLDRGGVASALRDFLRVNPLVTQVNAGLHAASKIERSSELDQALIDAAAVELTQRRELLPGGIRIFDSENRLGPPPDAGSVISTIEDLWAKKNSGHDGHSSIPPVEWRIGDAADLDIRFLETPLVRVEVKSMGGLEPAGAAPSLPINRQVSWSRATAGSHRSAYCPVLGRESFEDLPRYGECLNKLETLSSTSTVPHVSCTLVAEQALAGKPARWTVTGNAHMDPANLSRELSDMGQDLVLWEWRPAFLARSGKSRLPGVATARPYITISRLDGFFKQDLESDCKNCVGDLGAPAADLVLSELGTRGIGLSSLLSIGHTQTAGAIGFFLAFRALKQWEREDAENETRCLLPMDAINPVLEAIAGEESRPETRRRADILAVRAIEETEGEYSVALHPVEVKMRLDDRLFPKKGSDEVSEALGQLEASAGLLSNLADSVNGERDVLLLNSVASLMEAALSIRAIGKDGELHTEVEKERRFLDGLARGRCRLIASGGTLLWFQSGGQSQVGQPLEERPGIGDEPWQVFVNPLHLGKAIASENASEVHVPFIRALSRDDLAPVTGRQDTRHEEIPLVPGGQIHAAPSKKVSDDEEEDGDTGDGAIVPNNGDDLQPTDPQPATREDSPAVKGTIRGVKLTVGTSARGMETYPVVFDPSDTKKVNQLNMGVLGDLGTGKTQFLRSFVYQLSQSAADNGGVAPKTFIFDYKTDYIDQEFLDNVNGKLLAPGDEPIPLNFFALPPNAKKNAAPARARFFADIVDKVNAIGTVQRQNLVECVQRAYDYHGPDSFPLISDVLELYREENPKPDSVTAALSDLVDLEVFETNRDKLLTINELFDRTVVVDLKGMQAGEHVQSVLVILLIDLLFSEYMPSRPKMLAVDEQGITRRLIDSFLLVDEAHHIMAHEFTVLEQLMLQGRQFGMGVVLSSQYLSHFKRRNIDWAQPMLTWSIHKVPRITAKDLSGIGFTGDNERLASQIQQLETLHSVFKSEGDLSEGVLMRDKPYFEFFE